MLTIFTAIVISGSALIPQVGTTGMITPVMMNIKDQIKIYQEAMALVIHHIVYLVVNKTPTH